MDMTEQLARAMFEDTHMGHVCWFDIDYRVRDLYRSQARAALAVLQVGVNPVTKEEEHDRGSHPRTHGIK